MSDTKPTQMMRSLYARSFTAGFANGRLDAVGHIWFSFSKEDLAEEVILMDSFLDSAKKNVFDTILETGHDEDFVPVVTEDFRPTDAPAGSPAKLEVLAERVRQGLPLWHPEDRVDYAGLTGTVRPRD